MMALKSGTGSCSICRWRFKQGLLVQRKDIWVATRRSGFNSPAVHWPLTPSTRGSGVCHGVRRGRRVRSDKCGPMVERQDAALAWRRIGFNSRWVH